MKSENLPEIIRSLTPCLFGLFGFILILSAIFNAERLGGERLAYVIGAGGAFGGYAAGGFSPQTRQQSQTKIDQAEQVDIDNK